MRTRSRIAAVLLLALLLTGCSKLTDGTYISVTDHEETTLNTGSSEPYYRVHTYAGVRTAVLELVSSGAESGLIRTSDYEGNIQDDISRVCLDITRESAIGSYAVQYITHSVDRILGYYEVKLNISYRISEEELKAVQSVPALADLYTLVDQAIETRQEQLAVHIATLAVTERTLTNYVTSFYLEHPDRITQKPSVSVSFYPAESSVSKIISFRFNYRNTDEEESCRLGKLNETADALLADAAGSAPPELVRYCYSKLIEHCRPSGSGDTAYDALVNGQANSEGFAMAMQLLCSRCGVSCQVVEGKKNGNAHFWNIVKLGRDDYHIDAYAGAVNPAAKVFLWNDDALIGEYWWDVDHYPRCQGSDFASMLIELPKPETEPEDTAEAVD